MRVIAVNFVFKTEQKAAKRRKIEENRNLTLQTTNEDDHQSKTEIIEEKPQVNSSSSASSFLNKGVSCFVIVTGIQKHESTSSKRFY